MSGIWEAMVIRHILALTLTLKPHRSFRYHPIRMDMGARILPRLCQRLRRKKDDIRLQPLLDLGPHDPAVIDPYVPYTSPSPSSRHSFVSLHRIHNAGLKCAVSCSGPSDLLLHVDRKNLDDIPARDRGCPSPSPCWVIKRKRKGS